MRKTLIYVAVVANHFNFASRLLCIVRSRPFVPVMTKDAGVHF